MQRFKSKKKAKPVARTPVMALPVLNLPDSSQFRTSLILPHLTQRFALLRDEEGALISFETMQSHLKAQRANGRLTEDEELAVLHEFSMQSAQEARVPSPMGNYEDRPLHSAPLPPPPRRSEDHNAVPHTLEDFHRNRVRASSSTSQVSRFAGSRDPRDPFRRVSPSASLPNLAGISRRSQGTDEDEEVVGELPSLDLSRPRPRPKAHNEAELSVSQINRISRVLDDIQLELAHNYRPRDDAGDVTMNYTGPRQLLSAPSPAKSRLTDEDTEEIDPHMARLHRELESSEGFLRPGAALRVPGMSEPLSRSTSAQGSVYTDALDEQDDGSHRSVTPIAARQDGSPATLRHVNSFTETASTGSPAFSPLASRFPAVPQRRDLEDTIEDDDEDDTRLAYDESFGQHTSSHSGHSTNPPSFNLLSPLMNGSNSSLGSAGSSYRSDTREDDGEPLDQPKEGEEPFEFEMASHSDRSTIVKLSQETLGGLDLADVAMIQEALVRSASSRAASRLARSTSAASTESNRSDHRRFGAGTPLSMDGRPLSHLEEGVEDEAEELYTPNLTSDASHSPRDMFHDGPTTPSSEMSVSSSSSWKPPRPPVSGLHRSVASQGSDLASSISSNSRTPISNPSYRPGQVQRFPPRPAHASPPPSQQSTTNSPASRAQLQEQVAAQASAATAALKRGQTVGSPGNGSGSPISPTLRRHKSQKSIKLTDIGSPQLFSTSADLSRLSESGGAAERAASPPPPMPPLSPQQQQHVRKQSSTTALRSKILRRFDSSRSGPNGDEISPYDLPPISAATESNSPRTSAPYTPQMASSSFTSSSPDMSIEGQGGSPFSSAQPSPARAQSPVGTPTGSSFGRVLSRWRKTKSPGSESPVPSPPLSSQPTSPITNTGRPLAPPLNVSYNSTVGLGLDGSRNGVQGMGDWRTQISHPMPMADRTGSTTPLFSGRARPAPPPFTTASAASSISASSRPDSGAESIRQLMQAAADLGIDADKVSDLIASTYDEADDPSRKVVRRTVILTSAPPGLADLPLRAKSPSARSSIRRSQTLREVGSGSAQPKRHRKTSSDAGASIHSGPGAPRRSISDRPPTPPPDAHAHRRRRSADLLREAMPAMPNSPTLSGSSVSSSPRDAKPAVAPGLAPPISSPKRKSTRTDRTGSTYAGSLLDYYGDQPQEDDTMILASGRIPSPSDPAGRGATTHMLPPVSGAMAAGARVEVDEMEDGSLVWQVVRNLRNSDASDANGLAFHSRQSSTASSMMHLQPPAPLSTPLLGRLSATSNGSGSDAADALKLMIRRDRSPTTSVGPPSRPSFSSERSLQVYEADTADVGAIIDELAKGDAGSFDLVRQRSLQRVMQRRQQDRQPVPSPPSRQLPWQRQAQS